MKKRKIIHLSESEKEKSLWTMVHIKMISEIENKMGKKDERK